MRFREQAQIDVTKTQKEAVTKSHVCLIPLTAAASAVSSSLDPHKSQRKETQADDTQKRDHMNVIDFSSPHFALPRIKLQDNAKWMKGNNPQDPLVTSTPIIVALTSRALSRVGST